MGKNSYKDKTCTKIVKKEGYIFNCKKMFLALES